MSIGYIGGVHYQTTKIPLTSMKLRSWLIAGFGFLTLNTLVPAPGSAEQSTLQANLLDDLSNASVSVLTQLGYDCKTASAGAILCTKCQAEGLKQKCEAFTCDVATKKCRRKTADLPNIPGLRNNDDADPNDEPDEGIRLPSL